MSKFEKVEGGAGGKYRGRHKPLLVVYTTGYGRFNKTAVEQFIGDDECVTWYYNEADGQLGVETGGSGGDGSYALTADESGKVASMRSPLFKAGIDVDALSRSVGLLLEYDGEHDLLVADLEPLHAALEEGDEDRSEIDEIEAHCEPVHERYTDEDLAIPPEISEMEVADGRHMPDNPLDALDPETREMLPDGVEYDEIVKLCHEYDGVYPVADELGLSRSKGAFLLRKLGLLDYMGRPKRGDGS